MENHIKVSGRSQHYIPQSLIRGFVSDWRKDKSKTWVTRSNGHIFNVLPRNIGAGNYFYSEQEGDEGNSLDNKITDFEKSANLLFPYIRENGLNSDLSTYDIPKILSHLLVRTAHVRSTGQFAIESFAKSLAEKQIGVTEIMHDLGLGDKRIVEKSLEDEFENFFERNEAQLVARGFTKESLWEWGKSRFLSDPDAIRMKVQKSLSKLSKNIMFDSRTISHQAHLSSLQRSLHPEAWRRKLDKFTWILMHGDNFLLPDCLLMARVNYDMWLPMVWCGKEELDKVALPITSNILLVGVDVNKAYKKPYLSTDQMVGCAWDFLISKNKITLDKYNHIGKNCRNFIEKATQV